MSQTSVPTGGMFIGIAGQVYDSGPFDILSGFNGASVQVPFGYGVRFNGTTRDSYVLPTGFSNVLPVQGVNVFDFAHARAGNADPGGLFQGDLGGSGLLQNAGMQVGRKGRFLLPVESAPTIGHRGWCRGVATGTLTQGVWNSAAPNAAGPLGASYHVDCTRQVVFLSTSFTSADGSTLVAVAECDFTTI